MDSEIEFCEKQKMVKSKAKENMALYHVNYMTAVTPVAKKRWELF